MQPAAFDFAVERGDDVRVVFQLRTTIGGQPAPVDLTSSSFEMRVTWRGGSIIATDTPGGGLTVDRAGGNVVLALTAEQTAVIPLGRLSRYSLVRTTTDRGRRSYLEGYIKGASGEAPGDTTVALQVNDGAIIATIVDGGRGDTGPQGPNGMVGSQGAVGPKGDQGGLGPQGPPGSQGVVGQQGAVGPIGPKGDGGDKGDKGDPGDTGALDSRLFSGLQLAVQAAIAQGVPLDIRAPASFTPFALTGLTEAHTLRVRGNGFPLQVIDNSSGTATLPAIMIQGTLITGALSPTFAKFLSTTGWQTNVWPASAQVLDDASSGFVLAVSDIRDFVAGRGVHIRAQRMVEGQHRNYQTAGETNIVDSVTAVPRTGFPYAGTITLREAIRESYSGDRNMWAGTVASATTQSITLDSSAATLDPEQVRGCRVLVGSQFRYCDRFDPAGPTIYFDTLSPNPSPDWSPVPAGAAAITIDARAWVQVSRMPRVILEDLNILPPLGQSPTSVLTELLRVEYAYRPRIERLMTSSAIASQVRINCCYEPTLNEIAGEAGNLSNGHVVTFNSCRNVRVRNARIHNNWQSIDVGGDYYTHGFDLLHSHISGGYASVNAPWEDDNQTNDGLTTHGPCKDIRHIGCRIEALESMVRARAVDEAFIDCSFVWDGKRYPFNLQAGRSVRFQNCRISAQSQAYAWPYSPPTTPVELFHISAGTWRGKLVIDGLYGDAVCSAIISVASGGGTTLKGAISVRNLDLDILSAGTVNLFAKSSSVTTIEGPLDFRVQPGDVRVRGGGAFAYDRTQLAGLMVGSGGVSIGGADGGAITSGAAGVLDLGTVTGGVNTLALRINSAQRAIFGGGTSTISIGSVTPPVQVSGASSSKSALSLLRFSADATGPTFYIGKSRSTTQSGNAALAASDQLGLLQFFGDTGAAYAVGPYVRGVAKGDWSASATQSASLQLGIANGAATAVAFEVGPDKSLMDGSSNVIIDSSRHIRLRSYTRQTLPTATPTNTGWAEVTNPASGKSYTVRNGGSAWTYDDGAAVVLT